MALLAESSIATGPYPLGTVRGARAASSAAETEDRSLVGLKLSQQNHVPKSRMRETRTSGSVGGRAASRSAYPTRDSGRSVVESDRVIPAHPPGCCHKTTSGSGGDVRPSLRSALTLPPAN